MYDALMAKIQQYPEICKLLLDTDAKIIEYIINDNSFEDDGVDFEKNKLGILWMLIRAELSHIDG